MKRPVMILIFFCILISMLGIAVYFPASSLPIHSDFSAMYNTDLALVHRIPIYDLDAVRAFVQPLSGIPNEAFFLARFPYPAWYALSTFYLGFLPGPSAATLWFEMNLLMLFLSIWLLTDSWPGVMRLFMFPAALLFLPVLGALIVGQYDFPVLLGISLLLYGLRKESVSAVVVGAALVTFKPHVGALVFLFLLLWLFVKKNDFGRRSLKYIAVVLCGLILLGFFTDPHWISGYMRMLLSYQNEGNVTSCSECVSLPMLISRWLFDGSLRVAVLVGGFMFVLLIVLCYFKRLILLRSATVFIVTAVFAALLVNPYFYNYDFIFLLIPFAFFFDHLKSWMARLALGICYMISYLALGFYGRNGNVSLIAVTLLLLFLFLSREKNLSVA